VAARTGAAARVMEAGERATGMGAGAAARVMETGERATGTGAAARVMEAGERVMEAGGRAAVAAAAGCTVDKLNRQLSKGRPMGNQRGLHTRSRSIHTRRY